MTAPVVCHVRCVGEADDRTLELIEEVRGKAVDWASAICAHLGRRLDQPIVITLRPGPGLSMTKANQVLIPLNANTPVNVAALSHELVHVVAGRSPGHLLNEGLAVHVDDLLRLAGSVWPFYDLPAHRWVAAWRDAGKAMGLDELLATPPFTFSPSERARYESAAASSAVRRFYLHAGSFVRFLLTAGDPDAFWAAFSSGHVVTEGGNGSAMEQDWRASLGPTLTTDERRAVNRSVAELRRLRPTVWDPA